MQSTYKKLIPWLDKAYALSSALTLFEWDESTEAPEAASELNAKAVEILSTEYYNTIINDDVKSLLTQLEKATDLDNNAMAIVKDMKKQYDSMSPPRGLL